jgi:hypothetical protein
MQFHLAELRSPLTTHKAAFPRSRAGGNGLVIVSVPPGAEITVRDNVFVAVSGVGVVESDSPTAKVKLPAEVGVPDNTPALGDNAMPFGGAPLTTDHT